VDFGIMFFASSAQAPAGGDRYRLLLEAAKLADRLGFCCVWTPERHFHEFGGLFPNPALTSAALATITDRVQLRAGSLVSPLHDPIRIVEEWSLVDNLSHGRVAVSFGSGWNVNDFLFFPERYARRQEVMYEQIDLVRELWRGGRARRTDSFGQPVEVAVFPPPVQPELPLWITSSGSAGTFASAGRIGANLLTHLLGQDLSQLAEKIRIYRAERAAHGFDPAAGIVSLMLHTYVGGDLAGVRAAARPPLGAYLRSAISLEQLAAQRGGAVSGGKAVDPHAIAPAVLEELLERALERYLHDGALVGTPESCRPFVLELERLGVDEVACLVDFGLDAGAVLDGLGHLDFLRALCSADARHRQADRAVASFLEDLG
jgi:phthiocerol/phenolphthiocerol synthesis type-I polyketide synthase D